MSRVSLKKRAGFAAVLLVLILGAAEAVLRVHDFSFYFNFGADLLGMPLLDLHRIRRIQNRSVDFDPYLFWRFKPNRKLAAKGVYRRPVTINSMGFRGADFSPEKPGSVFRVACIGDSTTFGWSVGDQETYPYFLERLLNPECGKRVEVLNLGVTGYTSFQGRTLMERYAVRWSPDLVIFAFGPNDRLPALKSDREHYYSRTWDIGPVRRFLYRFQVYKLLKAGVVYLQNRAQGLSLDPATYIPRLKRKVSMEEYADNVRAVKKVCDQIGASLVLVHVDYPSLPPDHVTDELARIARQRGTSLPRDWKRWDGRSLHERLSRELGLSWLDLRELFAEALGPENEWQRLMVDNGHPDPEGHRLIARALLPLIKAAPAWRKACEGGEPER